METNQTEVNMYLKILLIFLTVSILGAHKDCQNFISFQLTHCVIKMMSCYRFNFYLLFFLEIL